jgi:hypothetical protein
MRNRPVNHHHRPMKRLLPLVASVLIVLATSTAALATPGALPPVATASTVTSTDADAPAMRARFDQGIDRLREGEASAAIRLLGDVAAQARMVERRAAAAALIAYARRLEAITGGRGVSEAARDLSDGRTEFIVTSTLLAFYGGVVVADVLDLDGIRPVVGTLLVTTGAGFAAALFGSRGLGLRAADGEAFSLGAVWGIATGLLISGALEVDNSEPLQLMTLGGGLVGGLAGLVVSRRLQPTRGQVGIVSTTMPLGFASALLSSVFLIDSNPRFGSLATLWLGGLQIGTFAGVALAPNLDWSASRARLTMLGSGLGALLGWGGAALGTGTNGDSKLTTKIWAGAALAGMWGGFALSAVLTEGMVPDPMFRAEATGTSMILPTVVGRSPGLAWTGRF